MAEESTYIRFYTTEGLVTSSGHLTSWPPTGSSLTYQSELGSDTKYDTIMK